MSLSSYPGMDLWSRNVDKFMATQPVIGNPYGIVLTVAACVAFIKILGPLIGQHLRQNKFDFRPIMLIFNGFWFGVSGAGVPMIMVLSGGGIDLFTCVPHDSYSVKDMATRYLVYTYAITVVLDMGKPLIAICRGKDKLNNLRLAHNACWAIVVLFSLALHPLGHIIFAGCAHCAYRVVYYGYLVMTCTSAELKLSSLSKWKRTVEIAHFLCFLSIFAQQSYMYTTLATCDGWLGSLLTIVYSGPASLAILVSLNRTASKQKSK